MKRGALLIISGPSGSGKSTMCKDLLERMPEAVFSISTTTRAPRVGERDGVDYFFVTKDEFLRGIAEDRFLEWAEVHGNYYGTSKEMVESALNGGRLVLFDIDVQGFKILHSKLSSLITSLFVTVKDQATLKERLALRKTDSAEVIEKRVKNAKDEMGSVFLYDYLIINEDIEESKEALYHIAKSAFYKSTLTDPSYIKSSWGI